MKKLILLSLLSPVLVAQTIPVEISVNWPPAALVAYKYGKLPSAFVFGEVIGCNKGDSSITFGEGDVIAALRKSDDNGGIQAFSRQDALSLVGNSQADSVKTRVIGWIHAGADSAVESKAAGLIRGGNGVGVGIVAGASFIKIVLPKASAILNYRQLITYSTDGLQATMQVGGGRCSPPGSVLFAIPAAAPKQPVKEPVVFTINIPVIK